MCIEEYSLHLFKCAVGDLDRSLLKFWISLKYKDILFFQIIKYVFKKTRIQRNRSTCFTNDFTSLFTSLFTSWTMFQVKLLCITTWSHVTNNRRTVIGKEQNTESFDILEFKKVVLPPVIFYEKNLHTFKLWRKIVQFRILHDLIFCYKYIYIYYNKL